MLQAKRVLRPQDMRAPISRQRGAALLFSLLLMIIGVGLFVVNASQDTVRAVQADKAVGANLGQAKEALIAYAVSHPTRPGALPCPDTNDDGIAEAFVAGACPAYIGRLPWLTLGVGDLRDDAAER